MLKKVIIILIVQIFMTSHSNAFDLEHDDFFDLSTLAGWKHGISKTETLPYINENIRSKFIWGGLSSSTSYVFITVVDNSLKRQAYDAHALNLMFSENSYSQFNFLEFDKAIESIKTKSSNDIIKMDALVMSVTALGSGYDFVSGKSIQTLLKKVYFPVVLKAGQKYFNYIIVLNYRGKAQNQQDLQQFDNFYKSFSIPNNYELLSTRRFNAFQPELVDLLGISKSDKALKATYSNNDSADGLSSNKPLAIVDVYDPKTDRANKEIEKQLIELNAKILKAMD